MLAHQSRQLAASFSYNTIKPSMTEYLARPGRIDHALSDLLNVKTQNNNHTACAISFALNGLPVSLMLEALQVKNLEAFARKKLSDIVLRLAHNLPSTDPQKALAQFTRMIIDTFSQDKYQALGLIAVIPDATNDKKYQCMIFRQGNIGILINSRSIFYANEPTRFTFQDIPDDHIDTTSVDVSVSHKIELHTGSGLRLNEDQKYSRSINSYDEHDLLPDANYEDVISVAITVPDKDRQALYQSYALLHQFQLRYETEKEKHNNPNWLQAQMGMFKTFNWQWYAKDTRDEALAALKTHFATVESDEVKYLSLQIAKKLELFNEPRSNWLSNSGEGDTFSLELLEAGLTKLAASPYLAKPSLR